MPCCLHGYPHPKHGCGSASLNSEYHECSFNSQNTLYNNYWVDAFCLFTELEEVTLQRDLFAWACRRQEKTSVRSSKQAPQIFTGRLRRRFWICRKTALGCHLGGQSCVVGMVGNGYSSRSCVLAAETVLQRWEGKGQCTHKSSLTLESAHIKSLKASVYLNITTVDRIQLSFGGLLHWQWKWALPGFGVVEKSEFGGYIHPTPEASKGHRDTM